MSSITDTTVRERLVFAQTMTHSVKLTAPESKVCTGVYIMKKCLTGGGEVEEEWVADFAKSTARTQVYKNTDSTIPTLYMQKSAFPGRTDRVKIKVSGNAYKSVLIEVTPITR